MDPYLEGRWGDVHTRLTLYACDAINPQLPQDLVARVEEYLALEIENGGDRRGYYPDVRVAEEDANAVATAVAAPSSTVTQPYLVPIDLEPPTQRAIQILDRGDRVITAIEFLSPGNKTGDEAIRAYRKKQRDFLDAGVSVVEIDLLREGSYVLLPSQLALPSECRGPYLVSVVRGWRRGQAEVYRASFQDRLPTISIPLRPSDGDVVLDLQALVERCYETGRYSRSIDYRKDPRPPLRSDDAALCDELLRAQGLR
jgi:hypothetical protein